MLVTLYKIGKIQFRLLGTNRFHTKNERFTAAASHCRPRTSNMRTFTSSYLADRVKNFTRRLPGGGGGDSYMVQTGMLVGNFEFNP